MSYYGLHIPEKTDVVDSAFEENIGDTIKTAGSDCVKTDNELLKYVFMKKVDALQMLKIYKDARMREFSNIEDAFNYAQTGCEQALSKRTDSKTCISSVEKPAFSAPTKQKLVAFRKAIESGDYEQVKSLIWDNPRYLVNSGDTPTSLKEGCRYNALHVCAIYNKTEIAELILKTVSDPYFVNLLTGNKNDMKMCSELASNLLDYYLNIPEKGRLETPLHLAVKYGNIQTVKLLTSYPICKMTKNKDQKLPSQIICTRKADATKTDYIKISDLLEKRFYVPVIRSVDNDVPPQIGEPFSADNPPSLSSNPINPELKIQALAGPMKEQEAKKFCRRWKTPPRLGSASSLQISNLSSNSKPLTPLRMPQENVIFNSPKPQAQRLFDNVASTPITKRVRETGENDTPIKDQWKPLTDDAFFDNQNGNGLDHESASEIQYSACLRSEINNNPLGEINATDAKYTQQKDFQKYGYTWSPASRTPNGIFSQTGYDVFEGISNRSFACERSFCDSPGFKERNIKITDTEKGLEVIGRKLAKAQMIEWSEYWDFLDTFVDIASPEGLRKLESFLERRARDDEAAKSSRFAPNSVVAIDEVCSAFERIGIFKENVTDVDGSVNNINLSQSTTPYTCVEKSLQVFAKRMTKTILHNIENIDSISDAFLTELKRLKLLICSFKDDTRFSNVNFSKVHSRFAYLITIYLQNSPDAGAERTSKIQNCISCILLSPTKTQLHCVCKRVKDFLDNSKKQPLPEDLKTEAMCSKAWLAEDDCDCQWETNLIRKTSRRNRIETRYKNHQYFQKETSIENQKFKDEEDDVISSITEDKKQIISRNSESGAESTDNEEDELFWSDFAGSETDEEEIWMTPPESPQEEINDKIEYNAFIYGAEPTKRDLDVLNAIFNVDININNYPNVYKWKMAVLRHTNDNFGNISSPHGIPKSRLFQSHINADISDAQFSNQPLIQKSPIAKRLFSSPAPMQKRPPLTPLNKMKGLFSIYREFLDSSPISVSGSMSEIESP